MTALVDADRIEAIVGAKRHPTEHIGRASSMKQQVYILHSQACIDDLTGRTSDLRQCRYSRALDSGIDPRVWSDAQDRPVVLGISDEWGDLEPLDADVENTKEGRVERNE